jgi:hypothetical protein
MMAAQIVIQLDDTGRLGVQIQPAELAQNKIVVFGILELAKQALIAEQAKSEQRVQLAQGPLPPAPGNPFAPKS